ncbi:28S ribosomal protein S18c mitochondrial [Dissostichus eleginoides]|uniref:28S ribosomal protein S18c mitochondrial n=1 Tax=Dissostichus eleginoides TaxID=100907 RepID=A0AAD9EVY5_DISEL|nr:28S ribosomal protein S18c mitochondrial [Dissostichus eleginoides]
MLVLRGLRRIRTVLLQQGNTGLRSLTTTSNVVQPNEDRLIKMENPYKTPQKGCLLCNVTLLSQFISPYTGRIYGRHITRLCSRKQKEVAKAVKKSHALGFMSVTHKHPEFMKDPHVCGKHLE